MSSAAAAWDRATFVRSLHPYAYKSGEWAQIVGIAEVSGRPVWLVVWPDGSTDEWVIDDPSAEHEFAYGPHKDAA